MQAKGLITQGFEHQWTAQVFSNLEGCAESLRKVTCGFEEVEQI